MSQNTSALISAKELNLRLKKMPGAVRLVDSTYSAIAYRNFLHHRIGNAVFFDIDEIADARNPLPHMLPDAAFFAAAMERLGLSSVDEIVVYDQGGLSMAAARAWWMFRVFGHVRVRVLDGGLPGWLAAKLPVNTTPFQSPAPGKFDIAFRPELVKDLGAVLKAAMDKSAVILDARDAQRFTGRVPEPRPGLRAGHIPGSINVQFFDLLETGGNSLRTVDELRRHFSFLSGSENLIASCGSGVTACVLALALFELGRPDVAIYDGSWTEWGQQRHATPIEIS